MQEDYDKYGLSYFLFQKLQLGAGLEQKELENLETTILLTLSSEQRYNVYTNWRKRGSQTNPFYNKTHTNKLKKYISQLNSATSSAERRKPLYIDDVYYKSVSEASEKTGIQRRFIRNRCHSTQERFQHYQWADKKIN